MCFFRECVCLPVCMCCVFACLFDGAQVCLFVVVSSFRSFFRPFIVCLLDCVFVFLCVFVRV